jgi:hypothetical protein
MALRRIGLSEFIVFFLSFARRALEPAVRASSRGNTCRGNGVEQSALSGLARSPLIEVRIAYLQIENHSSVYILEET